MLCLLHTKYINVLHLHRGSDEGLWAETSAVYINIPILQLTLKKTVVRIAQLEH